MRIIKGQTVPDKIRNSESFYDFFDHYNGNTNKDAIRFLNNVLDNEEKACLLRILYSPEGWYCRVCGEEFYRIKFTSWNLEFTNNVLFYTQEEKRFIQKLVDTLEQELALLKSVYIKQKLITYRTLLNFGYNHSITLYRGIKSQQEIVQYKLGNVESWTEDENIARRFAGSSGYVSSQAVAITDIWLYYGSVYKTETNPTPRIRRLMNIEKEFIIENREVFLTKDNLYRC